jgi:hypothetical protein
MREECAKKNRAIRKLQAKSLRGKSGPSESTKQETDYRALLAEAMETKD